MTAFKGLIPPIVTPLRPDGSLDEESLRSLIDFEISAGANGIFVLGSSGEAVYLDDATRVLVAGIASDTVGTRAKLLVGALDSTPARVIDQTRLFSGIRFDGVVVTTPYYANLSPSEVASHFRSIAAATTWPVLAYDIPGNAGRRLDHVVLTELLKEGSIAGLKDSSGSLTEFRFILDALGVGRTAAMLTGADILADLALSMGADGLIPGLANVRPDLFVSLIRASSVGDDATTRVLQSAITRLSSIFSAGQRYGLGRHTSELGALKYFLKRAGVIEHTTLSTPLSQYTDGALRDLDEIDADVTRILATGSQST